MATSEYAAHLPNPLSFSAARVSVNCKIHLTHILRFRSTGKETATVVMTTNFRIGALNEAFGALIGQPPHRVIGKVSLSYRSLDASTCTDETAAFYFS
jgi:hypothetical protein